MAESTKVVDLYDSMAEFESTLEDARMSATTDREEEFVAQTKEKYDKWGGRMFWSEKQDAWLRRIAGPDD